MELIVLAVLKAEANIMSLDATGVPVGKSTIAMGDLDEATTTDCVLH